MSQVSNTYLVEYKGNNYPSLKLGAFQAGIKRSTLTKAVNRKYAKQEIPSEKLTITVQDESFKITKFSFKR